MQVYSECLKHQSETIPEQEQLKFSKNWILNKDKEVGKFFQKISGGTLISDPRVHGLWKAVWK